MPDLTIQQLQEIDADLKAMRDAEMDARRPSQQGR